MNILSLRVEQFKKFDRAVLVDGFAGGLNLLAGPNETGKSTLLLALRAVLFERHGAKTQAVKDFAPHRVTGARPTITLDFDIAGERYQLEKSFLKRPAARLETKSGHRFEGSDAEDELKRLLGLQPAEKTSAGKDSPAHFGVLLTPQATSFRQPDLADGTRHSLEAAIADDIAELGNQSEVDDLIAGFDEVLFAFVNKRGKPKGGYEQTLQDLADVERRVAEARQERAALDDQLERLSQAIAERRDLSTAESSERLAERLASLEAARSAAAHRQMLENHRLTAGQQLQRAEAKQAALKNRQDERRRLTAELDTLGEAAKEALNRRSMIEETLSQQEEQLAEILERQRGAERRRRDLEMLGREAERLRQVETTLFALATDVRLELETNALGRVTLDGEPAPSASELRQVTDGLSIEIEGVGRIGIEPKIEPMRDALAAKAEAESRIGDLLKALDLEGVEAEAVDTAWQTTASEIDSQDSARRELDITLADERRNMAEAEAARASSKERHARLSERLAEIDKADTADMTDQASIDAEITDAKAALTDADKALQAAPQGEATGAMPDAEIKDLRARIDARRDTIETVNKQVAALESAIAVRSGLGLDDKLGELDRKCHLLTRQRDAFALDHRALSLLQDTLRAASDEAKATFNAPLSARLAPYIQDLFPGTTPVVTPDFSIRAIDRSGVEEPFIQLSDGTREQIAILARLAFADMLQEQGLPALIVLDDALAFSDEARLRRMIAILKKAAKQMQVIVLTCREDHFAKVEATRLAIAPEPEHASTAA